jgi:hypothetical protein
VIVTEGQRVIADRYQLITQIGSGGVGVVWRARDTLLDREVAVKEIVRPGAAGQDAAGETYQRTLTEARAAARIRHRGVAAVYDVISDSNHPCIVMELIEGRPLAQVIEEDGALPPRRVADIGRQLLAALTAGHAVGVLHRDLKPANVLITPSGRAVLTDFGIASVAGNPSITQAGVVLGTPSYLAPERAQGQTATPAADIWSLGATLYAAVSGQGPYDGYDGAIATLAAITTQDPPGLAVGGPLSRIILALMSRDPIGRPGAREAALTLEEAAQGFSAREPVHRLAREPVDEPARSRVTPLARGPVTQPSAPLAEVTVAGAGPDQDRLVTAPVAVGPAVATLRTRVGEPRISPDPAPVRRGSGRDRPRRRGRLGHRRWPVVLAAAAAVAVGGLVAVTLMVLTASAPVPRSAHLAGSARHLPADAGLAFAGMSPVPAVQEEFRVTSAVNADGTPELFARTRNGSLMAGQFSADVWSGWKTLPGGHIYTGVPAVTRSNDGRLVVVARTTSGMLAYLWQSVPGSTYWHGPVAIGSRLTSSDPAVIALPDGRLEVFARLGDDSVGTATQLGTTAASGWSNWSSLGGDIAGPPVVALNSDGDPELFAVDAYGGLANSYFEDGSWQSWAELPGGRVFTGVPSVGTNFDGRLEVFATTSSGTLEHVWQLPSDRDSWGGPLVLMTGIVGDPAVYNTVGGRIEAFAVTRYGNVVHAWQLQAMAGTGWSTPASIGGDCAGVAVPVRVSDQSDVFIRTPGGTIDWNHESASLSWSGWSSIGGSF